MAHDVFISHSTRDKPVSDAVCAALENAGIRCWVAPRDVQPGRSFAGEITRAIQQSKAMVLIFSANSNNSSQVLREVQLAVDSQLHILQFRIEEVLLNDDLKYYLSTPHWLDAMTPPLDAHLGRLATSLKTLLGKPEITGPASRSTSAMEPANRGTVAVDVGKAPTQPPLARPPIKSSGPHFWVPALLVALLLGGIGLGVILFRRDKTREATAAPTPIPSPSAPVSIAPVVSSTPATAASIPSASGKTAVYHFEEGAGDIVRDSSGNGRDLSLHGAVSSTAGIQGKGLSFPDSNQSYAQREANDSAFDFGDGDFTLEMACKFNSFPHEQVLIEKFSGRTGPGWTLTLLDRSTLVFHADGAGSFKAPVQLEPRQWYGFKVQRGGPRLKIFVDKTAVLDQPVHGFITASPNPLLLGRRNQEDGRSFPVNGVIDELQIDVGSRAATAAASKPFQQSWDFSAGMLRDIRTEGVEVVDASIWKMAGGKHLRFLNSGRSFLEATFDVPDGTEAPTRLVVRHLSSSPDGKQPGFSPVRITLNGSELFRGSPARSGWTEDEIDLGNSVQPGRNTLLWEYLDGAQTHYWLKSFRLGR